MPAVMHVEWSTGSLGGGVVAGGERVPTTFIKIQRPAARPDPNPPRSIALVCIPLGFMGLFGTAYGLGELALFLSSGGRAEPWWYYVAAAPTSFGMMLIAVGLWHGRKWAWLGAFSLALLYLLAMLVILAPAVPRLLEVTDAAWVIMGLFGYMAFLPSLALAALLRRSARVWCRL